MGALEPFPHQRVQLALGQLAPRRFDRRAPVGIGLVCLLDGGLAKRHPDPVQLDLERHLTSRELRLEIAQLAPDQALGGELEQRAVALGADPLDRLAREQPGVALVDRLDLERLLLSREVEVVLAVDLGHERPGVVAIGV